MSKFVIPLLIIIIVILVAMVYHHKTKHHCMELPPGMTKSLTADQSAAKAESFSFSDLGKNLSTFSNTLQRKTMNMGGAGSESYNPGAGTFLSSVYKKTTGF